MGIRGEPSRPSLPAIEPFGSCGDFSTYPPLGPHLAAWRLGHLAKLPWVADFRDPMGYNPGEAHFMPRRSKLVAKYLERRSMRAARAVVANTDGAAERLIGMYPEWRDKIHVIWNGFDPEARVRPGASFHE